MKMVIQLHDPKYRLFAYYYICNTKLSTLSCKQVWLLTYIVKIVIALRVLIPHDDHVFWNQHKCIGGISLFN